MKTQSTPDQDNSKQMDDVMESIADSLDIIRTETLKIRQRLSNFNQQEAMNAIGKTVEEIEAGIKAMREGGR